VEFKEDIDNLKDGIEKQKKCREQNMPTCLEDGGSSCKDMDKVPTVDIICSSSTEATVTVAEFEGGVEEEFPKSKPSDVAEPLFPCSSKYIAVEHNYSKTDSPRVWGTYGKSFLTTAERDMINYGKQLNDRYISHNLESVLY